MDEIDCSRFNWGIQNERLTGSTVLALKEETEMKQVQIVDRLATTIDEAWLTNALNGGLPW